MTTARGDIVLVDFQSSRPHPAFPITALNDFARIWLAQEPILSRTANGIASSTASQKQNNLVQIAGKLVQDMVE